MKKFLILFVGFAVIIAFSGQVYAASMIDVVETPTDYFVPDDSQK